IGRRGVDEDAVLADDRRGVADAGDLGLPEQVILRPLHRNVPVLADSGAIRPAKTRPVRGVSQLKTRHDKCNEKALGGVHGGRLLRGPGGWVGQVRLSEGLSYQARMRLDHESAADVGRWRAVVRDLALTSARFDRMRPDVSWLLLPGPVLGLV